MDRQPAEWAPHAACWVAWPSHESLWLENLAPARAAFVEMCRAIAGSPVSPGEQVEVLVPDEANESAARAALAGIPVRLHRVAFGDIWLRDTAPIFVRDPEGRVVAARFDFNGWGGKYRLPGDETVGDEIAGLSGLAVRRHPFILEGGAVEVDGEGTLLTTRQCLLNPNRNPGMDPAAVERALHHALGAEKVIWLDQGLENDHTDGHVDTLARFVAPGRVVCMAPAPGDPNREVLQRIRADLQAAVDARGRRLEVVEVPSPGEVIDEDGRLMPASHVNFYIGNRAVVVPVYGTDTADAAVAAVARLFPGRKTVGVDARAVLSGGGAFHCITQQQPAQGAAS